MEPLPAQPIKGLIDGLTVMQELTISDQPVSSSELSKKLGLEVTRVNRILKTLAYLGIAHRTNGRKYTPGPGIHVLAAQTIHASGLIQGALPHLEALNQYNHIVALGVLWHDKISYLYHWEPGISTFEALGRLALYPVEKSSIGQVLLSFKSEDHVHHILNGQHHFTKKQLDNILEEIALAKEHGYGIVFKPREISLAVPVGHPIFAGLALSGNFKEEEVESYLKILNKTAEAIEKDSQLK